MNYRFMDMGLSDVTHSTIYTLGPMGTSSEAASQFFIQWMQQAYRQTQHNIYLDNTYEGARRALANQGHGVLIVANAYPKINDFYMDPTLSLVGTFVFDTPLYGLVVKDAIPDRALTIASHPAPIPLIQELLPERMTVGNIIEMTSTSAAAMAVANQEVDMALTTEIAARIHNLRFISRTRPIQMLWSVFHLQRDGNV